MAAANTELFERAGVPKACARFIIPTVIGSLVALMLGRVLRRSLAGRSGEGAA